MNDTQISDWEARTRKNTQRLGFWTFAWVASLAVATFGPLLVWGENSLLSSIALLANVAVGAGMILANKHHLKGLDELQQRIQLEAMALALGVALVVGLAYSTAASTKLIAQDAEISYLLMLISLTYAIGLLLGRRRYR